MKKKLLTLILASISLFATPVFAADYPEPDVVEINQLTEDEIQYVESLPSVNEEEETPTVNESESFIDMGSFLLTAYCGCRECNEEYFGEPTASGTDYVEGRTIAVDRRIIPLGSIVEINIPGEGWHRYRAEDVGGAIKGNHIDVFVNGHENCNQSRYNTYCSVRIIQ